MISVIDSSSSSTSATASGKGIVYAIPTMHTHGIDRFDCEKSKIQRKTSAASYRNLTKNRPLIFAEWPHPMLLFAKE
jgi:hypothetical protein